MDSRSLDKHKKSTNDPTVRMESLPHEVAIDIFSRLPVSSLMRSRFVSPSWQNLTYDPNLIDLHCSHTAKNYTCLILHCSFPLASMLCFVDFSDNNMRTVVRKFQTPFPTPMRRSVFNVVGSSNGLICLSYSEDRDIFQSFQICNPFTRRYKNLPPISNNFIAQRVVVGFGYHPLTKEYKVVRIVNYTGGLPVYGQSDVEVYSLVKNDWRSIGKIPYQIWRYSTEPLEVEGRLHWLSLFVNDEEDNITQRLISFDIADEQFREVSTPPTWDGKERYYNPLAVLKGCLSILIYPCEKKLEIWVMKEYNARESWGKEYEIDINCPQLTWSPWVWRTSLQVLSVTENGRILMMHNGVLVSYDPERREFENVILEGALDSYQVLVHEGSLAWIENI